MQQRLLQGNVPPEGLAEYLVQHYAGQANTQSHKLGQDDSWVVQITAEGPGRGAASLGGMAGSAQWGAAAGDARHAPPVTTTVGIQRVADDALLVTMVAPGAISPAMAGYLVLMSVISLVAWPLAIFVLVWLVAALQGARAQRTEIWNQIGLYTMSRGALPGRRVRRADLPGAHAGTAGARTFAQPLPVALLPSGGDAKTRKLPIRS